MSVCAGAPGRDADPESGASKAEMIVTKNPQSDRTIRKRAPPTSVPDTAVSFQTFQRFRSGKENCAPASFDTRAREPLGAALVVTDVFRRLAGPVRLYFWWDEATRDPLMTADHSPAVRTNGTRLVIEARIGTKRRHIILTDEFMTISGFRPTGAAIGMSEHGQRSRFAWTNLRRFVGIAVRKLVLTNRDADILVLTSEDR